MNQFAINDNQVKQEPLENDDTIPLRLVDHFCRLCLRQRSDLVPILSRIQDMSVPEVFRAITGLELALENTYPSKTCRACMTMLDCALDIRQKFTESYQILKTFLSKTQPLINSLSDYQRGERATSETLVESNRKDTVDPHEASPKLNPCVIIPQPQEEPIVIPVQIKHDPELILNPEELPDPGITVANAITHSDDLSAENYGKMHNGTLHEILDPHKCYICNKVFEATKDVKVHLLEHVDMIPYQCSACTKETGQVLKVTSLNLLHRHFRMHVSAIKCSKCPHRTRTKWAMQTHMRTNHGQSSQTEYICKQCGRKFLNKRSYDHHIGNHKAVNEGRFTCSYCDKKFACKEALIRHERCHTNDRPYQCMSCPKSFKAKFELQRHEQIHTNGKSYQCNSCPRRFRLEAALDAHISKFHSKSEQLDPILTCKFEGCDLSTTHKSGYYNHRAKHKLRFECSQCSQHFSSELQLRKHQYVHTVVQNFLCQQCDKSFQSKRDLDIHVAGHNNAPSHACEICEMTFARKRSLKQHLFKHSAQLSFKCRHCGMKFRYRSSLCRHEKTHITTAINPIDTEMDVAAWEATTVKTETETSGSK